MPFSPFAAGGRAAGTLGESPVTKRDKNGNFASSQSWSEKDVTLVLLLNRANSCVRFANVNYKISSSTSPPSQSNFFRCRLNARLLLTCVRCPCRKLISGSLLCFVSLKSLLIPAPRGERLDELLGRGCCLDETADRSNPWRMSSKLS